MGAIRDMKKVLLKGPVLSRSGYGEHARLVFRALQSRPDLYDIYIIPTVWGNTPWSFSSDKETNDILHCISKASQYTGVYNVSLQVMIPNEWTNIAEVNIGVTAGIETDLASAPWVKACTDVDHVIVVSNHAKEVFVKSTYKDALRDKDGNLFDLKVDPEKIDVIGYPVKKKESCYMDLDIETDFNFLTVAQAGPRKCLDATVRWFVEEFKDENVGLVVKANRQNNSIIDRASLEAIMKAWTHDFENRKCKVYLLHGNLSEEEINYLYNHEKIKCYVTTTHGEGFGLPIFEAAYNGLPVVAPAWSGHTDFLYKKEIKKNGKITKKPLFSKVRYTLENVQENSVWEDIILKESKWAFSDKKSYQKCIRSVYEAYISKEKMAIELKDYLEKEMSKEIIHEQYVDTINKLCPPEVFEVSDWLKEIESNLETHE
tara:strand:- start:6582 stop:7871 length:1290 start_codon:yes stop_codon:yes gene_type:complete